MARKARVAGSKKRDIESYEHQGKKRANNPPVGLVTPQTDPESGIKKYSYDPHLDPQLVWAGKAERTSFEFPPVSLHVHERIEPRTILEAVRKKNGSLGPLQGYLFERPDEYLPLRDALDFYKHAHGWSNRLIAGDSLLVMNSPLEKEGLGGKVQMIFIDPPYGIKYGSNFQPFVNKRDVKDGSDEDLTQEPEMIRAFRDTWELGIHSYLSYLRDRLLLARQLLHDSGSCFVQISDENLHHVRELMDEVFGAHNFVLIVCYRRLGMMVGTSIQSSAHYLIWYCKRRDQLKHRKLFTAQEAGVGSGDHYVQSDGGRPFQLVSLATGGFRPNTTINYEFAGQVYHPGVNKCWRTTKEGLDRLTSAGRIARAGATIRYKQFLDDFPFVELGTIWDDTGRDPQNVYVVQTPSMILRRCLLMTTDPGDLVFDPTCGSGTTAFVAEQWGRRWITCDTSRVAIAVARQRLMTALYDYYQLAHPEEGVGSGFKYATVQHVTLKSIANDEPPGQETLYDKPLPDKSRARVTGPFTVEAVPAPTVKPLTVVGEAAPPADASLGRSGPALRHSEWRDELLKPGSAAKAAR
jgi:adenine-specific DNA-methyltransferase